MKEFTPDGLMIAMVLGAALVAYIIYALIKATRNNGIVLLPEVLMFGWWGSAPLPWLMFLTYAQKDNAALIAHERCHQDQQRRDGVLTFWVRYVFNKDWRYKYELEAYKVWLTVALEDMWRVVSAMKNYGFDATEAELINALKN